MTTSVDIERLIVSARKEKEQEQTSWFEKLFLHRMAEKDKAEFCTQLSVLIQSRVPLHRALEVLSRQASNPAMKSVIDDLARDIQRGNSLAKALERQPKVFESLFVVTAEVGQESGRLGESLSNHAAYLEKMTGLKRKFTQAMTYPVLVLSVAIATVGFLLYFIVPTFAEMFRSFQMELPASTKIVLGLSKFISDYGHWVALAILTCVVALASMVRQESFKSHLTRLAIRMPLFGSMMIKNFVARFCRTLGTLLQAQVSLVDALQVAQQTAITSDLKDEIGSIIRSVKHGGAVADPVAGSKLFPPMVAQMIAVGEETSELDRMLLKVAEYYEKEIDSRIETLSSVIEPVIILFLGLLVATILISMYLPMFDLVNVVGVGG